MKSRTDDGNQHAVVSVALLGGFRLARGQSQVHVGGSVQRLIAFLALRSPAARTQVAGTLWPDVVDQRAHGSLRTSIWQLQRRCPGILSATHGSDLKLSDAVHVDSIDFEAHAHRILGEPHNVSLIDLTHEVVWRELLPGWYDEWVLLERERCRQVQLHVLEATGEELLCRNKPGYALCAALAAIQAEPLRESAHRLMIRIHISEGNTCEAIRHYKWYRRILRDELGVPPTEQLQQLIAELPILEDEHEDSLTVNNGNSVTLSAGDRRTSR